MKGLSIDDSIYARVLRIHMNPVVGDPIKKTRDGSYDIGYVDLCFDDAEEQMSAAMRMEELIRIEIGQVQNDTI